MTKKPSGTKELNDRVVVITGGGSGIGKSTAVLLATKGYKTVIVGRNISNLKSTVSEVEKDGHEMMFIQKDINDPASGDFIIKSVIERFSRIDILVNNAGVPGEGVFLHEVGDNLWFEIINTNLTAAFRLIRAVLPVFIEQRSGNIINVASIAANVAMAKMGAYAVSKSGLLALTRAVAHDYSDYGVRCNSINPGATITDMTKSSLKNINFKEVEHEEYAGQQVGMPLQIARVIAFLCSPDSIHVNGTTLVVDGGQGGI